MTQDPAVTHDAHEGEEHHWHPPYWRIFFILLALTVVEMLLAFTPRSIFGFAIAAMIIIGVIKIAYIARYFMHLKFDARILSFIAFAPMVFAGCMVFYLIQEYAAA
jgi:caa(3)-type oxidase subunit IV